jgi:hypothetical protein
MTEIIDLVDTGDNIIGKIDRDSAHKNGVWHRTINFLIVDSMKNVWFSKIKKTNK